MSDLAKLTDAIVHEYLKTKDKNLAKVFEQKMNAVRNLPAHLFLFFLLHIFVYAFVLQALTVSPKI